MKGARNLLVLALGCVLPGAAAPALVASVPAVAAQQQPTPPAEGRGARGARGANDAGGPRVLGEDEVPQEVGAPDSLPPLVRRIEQRVQSVDADSIGRSRVELAGLVARGGGFTALVSDERDGARGYLRLELDETLAPRSAAEPLDAGASGKGQADGALAASADGMLCAVWRDGGDRPSALRGKVWSATNELLASWSMPLPGESPEGAASPSGGEARVGLEPALAWTDDACTVAFQSGGIVLVREIELASGAVQRQEIFGGAERSATSGPRLARSSSGALACAFDAGAAPLMCLRFSPEEGGVCDFGACKLTGLCADASAEEAGWWALLRCRGALMLRHLERSGAPDRDDVSVFDAPWRAADLTQGPAGPCVLVQPADGGLVAVSVGGERGAPSFSRSEVCSAERAVSAARFVCDGERCAFLWTERRSADELLFGRSALRGELGPERSLSAADGSAIQDQPAVAWAGERGVAVWTDLRFGSPSTCARALDAKARPSGAELFLPASVAAARAGADASAGAEPSAGAKPSAGAEPSAGAQASSGAKASEHPLAKRPAIALASSGRALAVWFGSGAAGPAVFAQALEAGADGLRALHAPVELDPGAKGVSTAFAPAVVALPGERGFAVAWVRAAQDAQAATRAELRLVRTGASGELAGAPRTVARGPGLAQPALALLDDGRVALAWDTSPRAEVRRLAARVFSEVLEPEPRELAFETMWRGSDHSVAITSAAGGFALAWTSGEDADCDVFARIFDTGGRPLSRPYALSTRAGGQRAPALARLSDNSFVAVWQDDLSGDQRLVGRRFSARSAPGSCVHFIFGSEPKVPAFAAPVVTGLGDGRFLVLGEHDVPGKGREIGLTALGPGWDQVEGR